MQEHINEKDALPLDIIEAWQKAWADVGWMGVFENGWLSFFRDEKEARAYRGGENLLATALRSFRFVHWTPGVIGNLPAPKAAFGLCLQRTQVTDAGLKELAGLKNLQCAGPCAARR